MLGHNCWAVLHKALRVLGKDTSKGDEEQSSNPEQKEGSKQRSKKGMQPLCRPIIAVCNDIYAPALRPLRAVAKVIQFKKPSVRLPSKSLRVHVLW